ncbi:MAG: hypothetical protein RR626_02035, partial [Anaerovoracaceae bacterium]
MAKIPVIYKKRIIAAFGIFSILLTVLCFRVGYMQVVKGEEYSKKAMTQQKKDEVVEAKRGAILDRNGTELAVSTVKYSVWVRPAALKVKDNEEKSKENLDKTVQALAEILEKEPAEIEEKLTQDISLVKVDKYLERSTADAIRKWVAEEKISGISITQETKREYPMNEFAAHLLGSVTDDNN